MCRTHQPCAPHITRPVRFPANYYDQEDQICVYRIPIVRPTTTTFGPRDQNRQRKNEYNVWERERNVVARYRILQAPAPAHNLFTIGSSRNKG